MGPCLQSDTECIHELYGCARYAPQRRSVFNAEVYPGSQRSGLSVFILKRKDLLEGDVCILYVTIVHVRHRKNLFTMHRSRKKYTKPMCEW